MVEGSQPATLFRLRAWPVPLPNEAKVAVARAAEVSGIHMSPRRAANSSVLVEVMRKHSADANVQISSCEKLHAIAARDAEAVAAAGGMAAVVAAMLAHSENGAVQRAGCAVAGLRACAPAIVAARGEGAVLGAMRAHPGDAALQRTALNAIRHMIEEGAGKAVIGAGAAADVVAAMHAHPAQTEVQLAGWRALRAMVFSEVGRGAVLDAGGIGVTVEMMGRYAGEVALQRAGCELLHDIAAGEAASKQAVVSAAAALVGPMTSHGQDMGLLHVCCEAIELAGAGRGSLTQSERWARHDSNRKPQADRIAWRLGQHSASVQRPG